MPDLYPIAGTDVTHVPHLLAPLPNAYPRSMVAGDWYLTFVDENSDVEARDMFDGSQNTHADRMCLPRWQDLGRHMVG